MILSDGTLRRLCGDDDAPLVCGAPDFEAQIQPGGIDVTVGNVLRLSGRATIGGPYRSEPAAGRAVEPVGSYYELDAGAYLFELNEVTRLPKNIGAIALPRSTLFRCGASLSSGLWDPGFCGRGRLGVQVHVELLCVEVNTTFAQLVFFELDQQSDGFAYNAFFSTE